MVGVLKECISKNLGRRNKLGLFAGFVSIIIGLLFFKMVYFEEAISDGISTYAILFFTYVSLSITLVPFFIMTFIFKYRDAVEKSALSISLFITGLLFGTFIGTYFVKVEMTHQSYYNIKDPSDLIGFFVLYITFFSIVSAPFLFSAYFLLNRK